MRSWNQDFLECRPTHCGHSLDAVFRLTADRLKPPVAVSGRRAIVDLMTHLAEVALDHVVLEVGTGSGYQAAILAHLARKVCTIEIIPSLAEGAAKALRELAYDTVSVRLGDGYGGWPECGPFDAI